MAPRRFGTDRQSINPSFGDLGLTPQLQARLNSLGLTTPLPVQAAALPIILGGHNAAIKSCTGSGKTLAYLLPVIQQALERRAAAATAAAATAARRDAHNDSSFSPGHDKEDSQEKQRTKTAVAAGNLKQQARAVQALIIAPSRELCIQIQRTAQDLLPVGVDRRLVQQAIGGANPHRQAAALGGGDGGVWPLVVVGTPGRVVELIRDGVLHLWSCSVLVLDEVDQLLGQKDVRPHVDAICGHVGRRALKVRTVPTAAAAGAGANPQTFSAGGSGDALAATPSAGLGSISRGDSGNAGDGRTTAAEPGAAAPARNGGGGGGGGAADAAASRQTIIISASLDARDLSRYSGWCPEPRLVVLGSTEALPPHVLQSQGTSYSAPAPPAGTSAEAAKQHRRSGGASAGCGEGTVGRPADSLSAGSAGAAAAAAHAGPLAGVLPPHLVHLYVLAPSQHRTDYVRKLIHALDLQRALLFVGRQNQAMVTKYKLEARNMQVSILHSRLTKLERGNILEAFRRGVFRALIVTDLGARGLDLPECDAAISLGPPADALAYAHRAGRTGRAGVQGVVASVVTQLELRQLLRCTRKLGLDVKAASISQGAIVMGGTMATAHERPTEPGNEATEAITDFTG